MSLTRCRDCSNQISRQARACPKCGAPVRRRSALGMFMVVLFVLTAVIAVSNSAHPRAASATPVASPTPRPERRSPFSPAPAAPKAASASDETSYPHKIAAMLTNRGFKDEGRGWHKSNLDGVWNNTLRQSFGENEISCLLESNEPSSVDRIELEAEFHQPGALDGEMLMQFALAAQIIMFPEQPPRELAEAIAEKREWSNDRWELQRIPYDGAAFGLLLKHREQ